MAHEEPQPYDIAERGLPLGDEIPAPALEALAAEHGQRVEYETLSQDTEGRWRWVSGTSGGTWREEDRPKVRTRARAVSDWYEVPRSTLPR